MRFAVFTSLCLSLLALGAPAPTKRQLGNLDCNVARLSIINDVASAQALIAQVQGANSTATDLPTSAALAVAQTGLVTVNAAVQTILDAVLENNKAPPAARDQVDQGLTAALQGLQSAEKTLKDKSLSVTLASVTQKIIKAGKDGNDVVAKCK